MSYSMYAVNPSGLYLQWPQSGRLQQPADYLDYTYGADDETSSGSDPIAVVSLSVSPSGAGEVTPERLGVSGTDVTVWMRGGVAGRFYTVKLTITTQAGRIREVLIAFPIDATTVIYPLPPPPSLDYGTPVTWSGP